MSVASRSLKEVICPYEANGLWEATLFKGLNKNSSQKIIYCGAKTSKLLHFQIIEGTTVQDLYLASVISRSEKAAWQSFQDLLAHAAGLAEAKVQCFLGLDLLIIDLQNGLHHFNASDFGCLLINHARTLESSTPVLIRYGQLFAVLRKRASADWGKIEVVTHVDIVDPEKTSQESFTKKMIRQAENKTDVFYGIYDISIKPLWPVTDVKPAWKRGACMLFRSGFLSE